jgi:hypothetical protein
VGTPNFRMPPVALGISTCLTGGGKYDPDDIRFHSLYKFRDRSCSNLLSAHLGRDIAPGIGVNVCH